MTDKEVIMIDGKDCTKCSKLSHCNNNNLICRSRYYAVKEQLQRKEQECEHYKLAFQQSTENNKLSADIIVKLQAENEELKQSNKIEEDLRYKIRDEFNQSINDTRELVKRYDRYKQVLEEVYKEFIELYLGVENKDRPYCERILTIINEVLKDE